MDALYVGPDDGATVLDCAGEALVLDAFVVRVVVVEVLGCADEVEEAGRHCE